MSDHRVTPVLPCQSRRLDVWCLRSLNDRRHGAERNRLPGGDARREMPLTNADILDHCAKRGIPVADVLCQRVNGLNCRHALETPRYNPSSRELLVCGEVVLQFLRNAENQIPILEAIEAAGWPRRIEGVLGRSMPWDAKHKLSDAVGELNAHQKRIHFSVEKGTQAVLWEFRDEDPDRQPVAVNAHGA